ncbi:MAG: CRTAC1 family protein, partial [Planctomycetota bacterium]|nr:CRTAC1 family protein [Planctomycetota bacterium]
RNNGNGTFDDVTEEAGLLYFAPGITASWADFDNDGWLDLCVGNESRSGAQIPVQLFRNNRDGTFTECASELGVNLMTFVRGIVWGDYNNDDRQDLYISGWDEDNFLFKNTAHGFENVTKKAGVPGPNGSFPTWFWDYNNDGWLDIFAAGAPDSGDDTMATQTAFVLARGGLGEEPRVGDCNSLYRNNGNGTFTDLVREAKIAIPLMAMGANFGDLDNDGYPDFYIGSGNIDFSNLVPNRMFRNAGGKFFQDVTTSGGFGHLQKGHGIAFVDMDNDGDQDIYAVMGGSYSGDAFQNALFLNPGHGNHWISLKLEGRQTNRSAIGVRVRVNVSTAEGERDIYTVVSEGGSFGASAFRRDIGLGKATAIQFLEIHWPTTGKTQKFEDVTMDKSYKLIEGGAEMEEVKLKRLKFAVGGEPSGQLLP